MTLGSRVPVAGRRSTRALALAACTIVTLSLVTASPAAGQGTPPPGRRMALGVSMLPWKSLPTVDHFAAVSGRMPALWSIWSEWGGNNRRFQTELISGLRARHVVPMVIWQPVNPSNQGSRRYTYQKIINGVHDTYIRTWAQAAKAHGGPVILQFAHEMDGYWFPWGAERFSNTPEQFKRMWRHVWRIFKGRNGVGATNVRFLWSPNNPCGACIPYREVYPGAKYIDYAGFTAFNWGPPYGWRTMEDAFEGAMAQMARLPPKPVIVAETGSAPDGGSKPSWIKVGYPTVFRRWPRIVAIVYFNVNMKPIAPRQPDWRLQVPAQGLVKYRKLLTVAKFQGSLE